MKKVLLFLGLFILASCQSGGSNQNTSPNESIPLTGNSTIKDSTGASADIEDGYTVSTSWPKEAIKSVLAVDEDVPEYKNFGTLSYKIDQDRHP